MYSRLMCSRIRVELASIDYSRLGIILKIIFAMYKCLTRSPIRVELAFPACFGLGII